MRNGVLYSSKLDKSIFIEGYLFVLCLITFLAQKLFI